MNVPHSVLIVDDETDIAELLADISQEPEREFHFAVNGQLALDLIGKRSIDLVVCDFTMPVMDGITFFQKARELGYRMPFVFLSGNYDNSMPPEKYAPQGVYIFAKTQFTPLKDKINELMKNQFPQADTSSITPLLEQLRLIHRGH